MSDVISSEKITEYVNTLLKKQNIFQKIDKIKSYTLYFILFSSVIGITTIFMNHSNFKDNKKSLDEINTSLDEIKNILNENKNTSTTKINKSNISNSSIDSDETYFQSIN